MSELLFPNGMITRTITTEFYIGSRPAGNIAGEILFPRALTVVNFIVFLSLSIIDPELPQQEIHSPRSPLDPGTRVQHAQIATGLAWIDGHM